MATRKKAEAAKEQPAETGGEEILQKAAKAIGSAIGTIAVKTGIATPPKKKVGKLVKKTRKRLPRKEKKQAKKASAKAAR